MRLGPAARDYYSVDDPGSLSPEGYSAIVSYLLRGNGYPAGEEELVSDVSVLRDIRVEVGDR